MRRKRTILLGAIALTAVCLTVAFSYAMGGDMPLGDVNGDGWVTAADAAVILRAAGGGYPESGARPDCDLTQNGLVSGTDARAVLWIASGGVSDAAGFIERISSGLCDERLFDRFCYNGVRNDGSGNYKSENVSITISAGREFESNYSLADIYVQDITSITNVFSDGEFCGGTETMEALFARCDGAILAMNGDYYAKHVYGPVVRNGVFYADRVTRDWDIGVLCKSGELLTFQYRTLTKETLATLDAYQTWVFGPALLDESGNAKTKFRSAVQARNPRSVIGYYEPGHYAFLVVDGRSSESSGLTMTELSQLCETLGFTSAYNLDGGRSSMLLAQNGPIGEPYKGGRPEYDAIVICEPAAG